MATFLLTVMLSATLPTSPSHAHSHTQARSPVRMTATAYCRKGTTDGGVQTRSGIIAADPRLLPIGSTVRVNGLRPRAQTFLVADSGSAVKGRRIDIFMPSCRAARRFGRRSVTVAPLSVAPRAR